MSDDEPTFFRDWNGADAADLYRCASDIADAWHTGYGTAELTGDGDAWRLRLITGGWSDNEAIVQGLQGTTFWTLTWQMSTRGGEHVFTRGWPR